MRFKYENKRKHQCFFLLNKIRRLASVFLIVVLLKRNELYSLLPNYSVPFVCMQLQFTNDDVTIQIIFLYAFIVHPRDYGHNQLRMSRQLFRHI
jgi:hypothetical protein